ncbi:MAG: thioredoxin domain-containing protein, partial [Thiotrichaceae bacterium]|nr:thioredoxin domain-containing protein [Thiotrichaceae bacterium]
MPNFRNILFFIMPLSFLYGEHNHTNALIKEGSPYLQQHAHNPVNWYPWGKEAFGKAKKENKLIFLSIGYSTCHWCHVMEETTYKDERVVELLKQKYITVRVDQDTNPDLLARYGDYGWPATIVFAPDGSEIVKRRGYINPRFMAAMLQAIIDDPSPGPSVITQIPVNPSSSSSLTSQQKEALLLRYFDLFDAENGGWGFIHKFINADAMDYALSQAKKGDKVYEFMARHTLHSALNLIDPVWGGVYQYSDQLDWLSPHYEKIMSIQTQSLRLYSQAWSLLEIDSYREAANKIYSYLNQFLKSPEGLYYTSQDADLNLEVDGHKYFPLDNKKRRALGMPHIDTHIYSKDNAWIIRSFVAYANATGLKEPLDQAKHIAAKLDQQFALPNGGFKHGLNDIAGPYLSDSVAMAQAYLALYQSTGNQRWLSKSKNTLNFIQTNFKDEELGGYFNSKVSKNSVGVFNIPVKQRDELIQLARTANLAYHYTGDESLKAIHEHAMKYMTSETMLNSRFFLSGLLLADDEAQTAPVHITVVGKKTDHQAEELHAEARKYPVDYLRVDWWDKTE